MVRSTMELREFLKKWLKTGRLSQIYISELNEDDRRQHPSLKRYGNQCIQECRITCQASEYLEHLSAIAEMYVQGYALEFEKLFIKGEYHRLSLPTYPFAKERFWIEEPSAIHYQSPITHNLAPVLHPLVHENTSNFEEQRFSSTFTGKEFFLADDVVHGRKVLPGVAYLEMAQEAFKQASEAFITACQSIQLKNVVWARPVTVGDDLRQFHVGLFPEENGEIAYEIYTNRQDVENERIVHCQGMAAVLNAEQTTPLGLADLLAKLKKNTLSSQACYKTFKGMGIDYGLTHQALEKIYVGDNEVLAKLTLPVAVSETKDQFTLHPSVLDSALQAAVGLEKVRNQKSEARNLYLPFALERLEIIDRCAESMWAWIRHSIGSTPGSNLQKFDIDLCDDQGNVCVRTIGLKTLEKLETVVESPFETDASQSEDPTHAERLEIMTFAEVLREQEARLGPPPSRLNTLVCFLSKTEYQDTLLAAIREYNPRTKVIFISQGTYYREQSNENYWVSRNDRRSYQEAFRSIHADHDDVDAVLYLWALEDFGGIKDTFWITYILQALASAKLKPKQFLLAGEFRNGLDRCYLESWIGFERSLRLVLPGTRVSVLYQEAEEAPRKTAMKEWAQRLWAQLQTADTRSSLFQDGKQYGYEIQPTTLPSSGNSPLKTGGTYFIIGGFGGLGLLFAKHLARTLHANLILTGRSSINEKIQNAIQALEAIGGQVLYVEADVCSSIRMKEALRQGKERFGEIHGVIHAAGIQEETNILEKEMADFQKVLDPKIKGTLVLEDVFRDEALDFVCYFSSASAVLGDFGSCDYAIGNRFQLAYGQYGTHQDGRKRSPKRTMVINWPPWKDGGMHVGEDETARMYLKSSGQRFLEAEEGIAVFEHLLSQPTGQHLVLVGKPSRVHRFLNHAVETNTFGKKGEVYDPQSKTSTRLLSDSVVRETQTAPKGLSLKDCVAWDLKQHVSELLKIPRDKLDLNVNLADFGFDSISLAEFAKILASQYEFEVTPSVFFGHSTLEKLADYFLEEHPKAIEALYKEQRVDLSSFKRVAVGFPSSKTQRLKRSRHRGEELRHRVPEPIAIIGMSGRFPQARTIDEMWAILVEGRDVVEEIPEDRFDWREVYGDPIQDSNKTNCKWSGFIPGVREFDPLFFEISPGEAEEMDPRQRLLLQESWKALEDSGYGARQVKTHKIGIFVGVEDGDYHRRVKANRVTSNHNAILASRLAYFLNLTGPTMAINTACSSSLVAAHQACMSLRNKECDTAIAAGVNLMLTPEVYVVIAQAGMLSSDGKSFAFDKRANGMVPGEAVAAVVLKRLSQAEKDGDPIYATIVGSGINYDGKTNGITAPSGVAQRDLLQSVYNNYQINPEEISYIVTHGTGTKLGDPVEINALFDAFKKYTSKQNFCALTSTKTNFGHTFAASGLVSIISLVQALNHETIPTSLHCEEENDYIQWKESPFYVNKCNKRWPRREGNNRTGAVSAFGMSGTNAHMVIKEYSCKQEKSSEHSPYFLLALSAESETALNEKIKDMITFLEYKKGHGHDLYQVSYTLLEGRHHFRHRCAIVIQDEMDAVYVWKHIGSKEEIPNVFQGHVPQDFKGQKAIQRYAEELITRSRSARENRDEYQEILYALADLYCQGYEIHWSQLYGDSKPRRIRLPTYPFAKERYWINEISDFRFQISDSKSQLHPLVHENTSNFEEQRFSSTFTGDEFFLADHRFQGQKILPGVAYLEMARAAAEQATSTDSRQGAGSLTANQSGMRLNNIAWVRPIVVEGHAKEVHIRLFPDKNRQVLFEIYTESDHADEQFLVHSEGMMTLGPSNRRPPLDLTSLQKRINLNQFSSDQCYEAFKAMGIDYGAGHQGIKAVYAGNDQVLAKLVIPSVVGGMQDQFVLHPSIMDSALQASIGVTMGSVVTLLSSRSPNKQRITFSQKASLPFALEELEIIGKHAPTMWAWIRYSESNTPANNVQKLDIDLCDDQGRICVRMKGFSSRAVEEEARADAKSETLIGHPVWDKKAISNETSIPEYTQHLVIMCELNKVSREGIEAQLDHTNGVLLQSKELRLEERYQDISVQVFERIKGILERKDQDKTLVQILIPLEGEGRLLSGLSGLLKTAHLENPKILGQVIEIDPDETEEKIPAKVKENSLCPEDVQIRYQSGKRYVRRFQECNLEIDSLTTFPHHSTTPPFHYSKTPLKQQGIYLITGGVGGLGLIFAREIASRVKDSTLILTGRSKLTQDKQEQLKAIEALGARIDYRYVDVSRIEEVEGLFETIQEEFGSIHGILHCAGVIQDNFILKKTAAEFKAVLAPKVAGTVNLDQASRDLRLDFFLLFSSNSGIMGNPGQSDYATANAFMDAFAQYRDDLVISGERHGQTLSIDWPFWKDGGMRLDVASERAIKERSGIIPLQTSSGISAFYKAMNSGQNQVMVMVEGNLNFLKKPFQFSLFSQAPSPHKKQTYVPDDTQKTETLAMVKQILANAIKLSPERIQLETTFDKYGIDSIMQVDIIRDLEKVAGELPKTLLFEYNTTRELVEYLITHHSDELLESIANESDNKLHRKALAQSNSTKLEPSSINEKNRFARLKNLDTTSEKRNVSDIAIIGISGRYPLSNNLDEFWERLKAGENCIRQAPTDRWRTTLAHKLSGNGLLGADREYYGGFLDFTDRFDHELFEVAEKQVRELSPECRLFLEIAWETFENGGYTKPALQELQTRYQSGVGVFVGTMYSQFSWSIPSLELAVLNSNNTDWQIANRTSHFFNLTGPSIAVNSACSSSLTAIHLACESLKQRSCLMAIAGGINLTLDPSKFEALKRAKFLGSGNQSKSFGVGDGYLPGEGIGAVLLKPLSYAIQDNDRIEAVIKSSFINHGGGRQIYSAPDPKQQTQLIVKSIQRSGIDPTTIGYIESAANGSEFGDAIEVVALNNAFKQNTKKQHFCSIGSVKSNLGHLEAASGISQLSKVLLQMKHKTLVPSINANPPNPNIHLEGTAFYLQQETTFWSPFKDPQSGDNIPRRSMINSFGAGGAYANLIVEEYVRKTPTPSHKAKSSERFLFIFSAKTVWSLMKYLEKIQAFLKKHSNIDAESVAGSLQKLNHDLDHRLAVLASTTDELMNKLDTVLRERETLTDPDCYLCLNSGSMDDSEPNEAIHEALEKGDIKELAHHWVRGTNIDFSPLFQDTKLPFTALPTYAFDHTMAFNFGNHDSDNGSGDNGVEERYRELYEKVIRGELADEEFENLVLDIS